MIARLQVGLTGRNRSPCFDNENHDKLTGALHCYKYIAPAYVLRCLCSKEGEPGKAGILLFTQTWAATVFLAGCSQCM
jgi:hypothetical protein